MSDFIKEQVKKLRETQKQPIKSKVMYNWDFVSEVKELVEILWDVIEKDILPVYKLDYINFANASLKIKVNDKEQMIEKMITFNLAYNRMDEKFGYIDPQFICDEISKKTKVYSLGRFFIKDKEKIIKAFLKMLIQIIEEY